MVARKPVDRQMILHSSTTDFLDGTSCAGTSGSGDAVVGQYSSIVEKDEMITGS